MSNPNRVRVKATVFEEWPGDFGIVPVTHQKESATLRFPIHGVAAAQDCDDPVAHEVDYGDDPDGTKPEGHILPFQRQSMWSDHFLYAER